MQILIHFLIFLYSQLLNRIIGRVRAGPLNKINYTLIDQTWFFQDDIFLWPKTGKKSTALIRVQAFIYIISPVQPWPFAEWFMTPQSRAVPLQRGLWTSKVKEGTFPNNFHYLTNVPIVRYPLYNNISGFEF